MGSLGVPEMTKAAFIHTECDIGEWWKGKLMESMLGAGREKRLAELACCYHQRVPAITIIVVGAWSKRSHKHSDNANSTVGIIVEKATVKLLHVRVHNKFLFSLCSKYSTRPTSLLQELECVLLRNGNRCDCGRISSGRQDVWSMIHNYDWGWRHLCLSLSYSAGSRLGSLN